MCYDPDGRIRAQQKTQSRQHSTEKPEMESVLLGYGFTEGKAALVNIRTSIEYVVVNKCAYM